MNAHVPVVDRDAEAGRDVVVDRETDQEQEDEKAEPRRHRPNRALALELLLDLLGTLGIDGGRIGDGCGH